LFRLQQCGEILKGSSFSTSWLELKLDIEKLWPDWRQILPNA